MIKTKNPTIGTLILHFNANPRNSLPAALPTPGAVSLLAKDISHNDAPLKRQVTSTAGDAGTVSYGENQTAGFQ